MTGSQNVSVNRTQQKGSQYNLPTYNPYDNSTFGYGPAATSQSSISTSSTTSSSSAQGTGKSALTNRTSLNKLKNLCAKYKINFSDDALKRLLDTALGELSASPTNEDIEKAISVIGETIKKLIANKEEITLNKILENIEKVRLAKATGVEYNGRVTAFGNRLANIKKSKNITDDKEATKILFYEVFKLSKGEKTGFWNNCRIWVNNAISAIQQGEISKAFRSLDITQQVKAAQTLTTIIEGATPEEQGIIQAVITELSSDDEFQNFVNEYLQDFQTEMLTRSGEPVADNTDVNLTYSKENANRAEQRVGCLRSNKCARKANEIREEDTNRLYEIRNKLKNGEKISDDDFEFLTKRWWHTEKNKNEVTLESVQATIDGILTDLQRTEIYATGCNKKISQETRGQIIHNNTRHENGEAVVRGVEELIEENPDALVVEQEEFRNEIETIYNQTQQEQQIQEQQQQLIQEQQQSTEQQNYESDRGGGEYSSGGGSYQTYHQEGTGGQSYISSPPVINQQHGSFGFSQQTPEAPIQTMRSHDLYPEPEENYGIKLIRCNSLEQILSSGKENIPQAINEHIRENGILSFVSQALNCKGAMDIDYIKNRVLQFIDCMSKTVKINLFNKIYNNKNALLVASHLSDDELCALKVKGSHDVKIQIEQMKEQREKEGKLKSEECNT